ncbi:MAG: endo-beta-N-acetylglucosaminidase [Muribaculaceae bacterium]|nr:endo-beta-N-acetylglucosaminidase [Muribaculaceae bacterium]
MKYLKNICILLAGLPLAVGAQQIKTGYVDKGICGSAFPEALKAWEKGQKWSDDDNFYISRVKPRQRFRNQATQVNPELNEENDKKLILWVPVNNEAFNALPDGVFDSEVFPMWSYVTHYGNWSSPLVRVPGGFLDVAHKNGVPVSALASIPYGNISKEWKEALVSLAEAGPEKLSDYLLYYGVDGIGYNSEFSSASSIVTNLADLHEKTLKLMKAEGKNDLAEFIWYDGTNKAGKITFDRGLAAHNRDLWGFGDNIRSSLFLNYNWNFSKILESTVANAKEYGRTPLDIFCGINMQGREPHNSSKEIWSLLEQYPVSIGLWGAHSENMFFESRAEQGSSPIQRQRTYLNRMMNWFTNGAHNPIADMETTNSLIYSAAKDDFSGMSKMMSARSALKWNLDDEPFITYFNLGNGRFFNWNGERCHNSEWYNIAAQDYLPTWMWWFSSSFMGRDASDLPTDGLKAEFVWDDAWNGGSTVRVAGNASEEYLHLFKTEFPLKAGDEITFRYKLLNGSADAFLAMSLKGEESKTLDEKSLKVMDLNDLATPLVWTERKFTVGSDIKVPDGGEVAMIALHFKDAVDLDMRFGELSIKRPSAYKALIESPVVESTQILSARHDGVDAKIIFNMPNDKGNDICYNSDVNASLFKLYAQQEQDSPTLMGVTTSWAGLMFSVPNLMGSGAKYRFGVSALALDHLTESEICWGEWLDPMAVYTVSDDILISDNVIHPNERFEIYYADPEHETADWTLTDCNGKVVAESQDAFVFNVRSGLTTPGIYDLTVNGLENTDSGTAETVRILKGFVQVIGADNGDVPKVLSLDVPGSEVRESFDGVSPTAVFLSTPTPKIEYAIDAGGSFLPRGVKVGDNGLGFRFKETGLDSKESFAISFWFKPESFENKSVHALNIHHKGDPWSVNNWGWMWHTLTEEGRSDAFTIRMASGKDASYRFDGMKMYPGAWYHMAYSFEFDENGCVKPALFINGERQQVTSWSLGDEKQDGDVDFAGPVGAWKKDNVVAFGGYLHKIGSVRGNVDNFMVWSKALSEEDAALAMADIKANSLPDGVIGYFDFEGETDGEFLFSNEASGEFKVGIHGYQDTEVEGQGTLEWRAPEFCTGCPFTSGDSFSMTPTVTWYTPGASVIERQDNGEDGYIMLSYPYATESVKGLSASMFVENEYGLSEKKLSIFLPESDAASIVEEENVLNVSPRIFDSEISVDISEEGLINLSLYSMDGRCVLSNMLRSVPGVTLKLYPDVPSGAYILRAEKDGVLLGASKLLRR